jgi:hypothetical protein
MPLAHAGDGKQGGLSFEQAKARADELDARAREAGRALDRFPRGAMNLVPDHIKATPAYREAKSAFDAAFQAQRNFNAWFVRAFKRERAQARAARKG